MYKYSLILHSWPHHSRCSGNSSSLVCSPPLRPCLIYGGHHFISAFQISAAIFILMQHICPKWRQLESLPGKKHTSVASHATHSANQTHIPAGCLWGVLWLKRKTTSTFFLAEIILASPKVKITFVFPLLKLWQVESDDRPAEADERYADGGHKLTWSWW